MHFGNKLFLVFALLAATAAADTTGKPTEIPFTLFKTNIVVDVDIRGRTLPFVFDTGISRNNILSAQTANELGLEPQGQARFRDSAGGRGGMPITKVETLRIGDTVLRHQIFAVAPLPDKLKRRPGKSSIAGYLGPPLMRDAVVCIDYQHKVLHRWPGDTFDADGYDSIPMPRNHGLLTIEVTVDGLPATLAVDTGADSGVHLFPAFVREHDLHERYPGLESGRALSGGGRNFTVFGGVDVEVGLDEDATLDQIPLLLTPQAFDPAWGIDGFVGYGFLSRLGTCLDRDGELLMWQPISDSRLED